MSDDTYALLFDRIRVKYLSDKWYGPELELQNYWNRDDIVRFAAKDGYSRYYRIDEDGNKHIVNEDYNLNILSDKPEFNYAPATEEQLAATEEALGFALPPLLRALYTEIANGGFGPRQGIMGAIGGFVDNRGNIVDAYLWRKKLYRLVDLTECEKQAYKITMKGIPFKLVSNLQMEPPDDIWPEGLLEFFHHGCGDFSCIDVRTDRIFVGGNPYLWYEANSLKEWLERWLRDDMYVKVEMPKGLFDNSE